MSTTALLALFALGGVAIWVWTTPGGINALLGGPGVNPDGTPAAPARPFLSQDQINYYMQGFMQPLTAGQAAMIGAQAGAPFAVATFGISVGIGALIGYFTQSGNETKEDRIKFAKRLGFPAGLSVSTGHNTPLSSPDDTSKGLLPYLVHHGYHDTLVVEALNIIGRTDYQGNATWMLKVLEALWRVNYRFPV